MITANPVITRRAVLGTCASLFGSALVGGAHLPFDPRIPIIDAHTHFSNPAHSPVAQANATMFHPDTPEAYRQMVEPLGVRGTIVVETGTWIEDNQWILDLAAQNKIIVGYVGHLQPGTPEFRRQLLQLHTSSILRGIRYGNLWGWDLDGALQRSDFVEDLKFLAGAGLELDAVLDAPGFTPTLSTVLKLTDAVPNLRVVIDHLPFYFDSTTARDQYEARLHNLKDRPLVYAKLSGVLRKVDNRVPVDLNFYRPLWDAFGPDRLIYGSNWPPVESLAPYDTVLSVVREFFATKGENASRKFFWDNSRNAYKWIDRD
jgi:L-fuconolactonase